MEQFILHTLISCRSAIKIALYETAKIDVKVLQFSLELTEMLKRGEERSDDLLLAKANASLGVRMLG